MGWNNFNYLLWKWAGKKILWLVLNNPTHTLLQYLQYLICETSVIVFARCAIVMVWGKQAACEHAGRGACWPAWLRWNRQQSKINCFCLAGTTLWSHPPNREFPAAAALTQQLAQSNRKKTKRKRSGRKAEVGAWRLLVLSHPFSCHVHTRPTAPALGLDPGHGA